MASKTLRGPAPPHYFSDPSSITLLHLLRSSSASFLAVGQTCTGNLYSLRALCCYSPCLECLSIWYSHGLFFISFRFLLKRHLHNEEFPSPLYLELLTTHSLTLQSLGFIFPHGTFHYLTHTKISLIFSPSPEHTHLKKKNYLVIW